MYGELIPLTSPEKWRQALAGLQHSFAHTWENSYAMNLTTGNDTFLYVYESERAKVVCPISERDYKGFKDIVTPYGFSGFTGRGEDDKFQQNWKNFAREKNYVCGYIGLNPVIDAQSYLDAADISTSNTLYVFHLKNSLIELFNNLSQNRKRQLKNFDFAQKNFVIDKARLTEFFLANYFDFFAQKEADFMTGFSVETLKFLLGLEQVLMIGYEENGEVKAVSVFSHTPYVADYLYNISVEEGRAYAVPLIWYAVHYFKSKQVSFLNLGGGVQPGDSIAQFKMRFGPDVYPLNAAKQVYNVETYAKLCIEKGLDPQDRQSYFPLYRKN
ncbi:MAG: hypothetical protein EOO10_11700 [Chitinophagaceae bacterium]|nr:MAG: hypothetical protein EOO10_11700 [Chitinophagaceae bacterium]